MADAESISLEETNKIRISLGLKPLTDDKAPANSKEKEAEDNYAKRREQERREKETGSLAARIAKNKNKRELNRRLVGATLGDEEESVDDARTWIKRSKKKEKELAAKRQAELDAQDALVPESYTENDLTGLKVSHDFEDLAEGENKILTLKDSRILDNEEDELHNIDMAEAEGDKKRNDLKTKNRNYTGYDDEEFGPAGDGLRKAVLAKYDEDINGAQEQEFRLGSNTQQSRQTTRAAHEQAAASVNKTLLSIDYAKNVEISDYAEAETGFKKPKTKKKKRTTRRAPADLELEPANGDTAEDASAMQMDVPVPRERDLDANFIDDEDLQAALSRSRRQKVKRTKVSPEEIAQRLAAERAQEALDAEATASGDHAMNGDAEAIKEEDTGLTFDDTTEFVRAIAYEPVAKPEPKPKQIAITIKTRRSPSPGDEEVTEMDVDGNAPGGDDDDEEMEDDEAILNLLEQAMAGTAQEAGPSKVAPVEDDGIGTKVETFGRGLAGTLSILRKQGIVAALGTEAEQREKTQKDNDMWLADNRRRIAQREIERLRGKGTNKDQNQREYENRQREQQEARDSLESFKNYKPDVQIVYYDDFGRAMDSKEAWKALSHRFHGKGSGKAKTEKRLKKIADERKREAMISGDTPTSMNQAFQQRQEKVGQAHMVLSVGNRGAVPQLEDYLDNAALSKSAKTKGGKGKKREGGTSTPIQQIDITAFAVGTLAPGVIPASMSAEGSPAPPSGGMMRPAFSRIGDSASATPAGSGAASPASGADSRAKVKIGFGMKRKAADAEGFDTPPPKR